MFDYMKAAIGMYLPNLENVEIEELEGQGMVEYGLILALVSVVAIAVLAIVGDDVADVFQQISEQLQSVGDEG